MICSVCTTDFNEKVNFCCPVCGKDITMEEMDNNDIKWILVFETNNLLDAGMFKANLEGADIPVELISYTDSSRLLTLDDVVKIYVPSIYYNTANEIVEAINKSIADSFDYD